MRPLLTGAFALLAWSAAAGVQAVPMTDTVTYPYWGTEARGVGNVIGNSTYEIDGGKTARVNDTPSHPVEADGYLLPGAEIAYVPGADVAAFSSVATHWGETGQNDVIDGNTRQTPIPGTLPLLALGLAGLAAVRQRRQG